MFYIVCNNLPIISVPHKIYRVPGNALENSSFCSTLLQRINFLNGIEKPGSNVSEIILLSMQLELADHGKEMQV